MTTRIFFDTETTGVPRDYKAPWTNTANWPRIVQIAWQLYVDESLVAEGASIVRPDGFVIPEAASRIHKITTEDATTRGIALASALDVFSANTSLADEVVGHNIDYDRNVTQGAHNAIADVAATARCFFELERRNWKPLPPEKT